MKTSLLSMCLSALVVTAGFTNEKVSVATDFTGVTTDGQKIKLSDYKGKVVILDFWASWCTPCRQEFPFLIELYNQYRKKGLVVIGINLDERSADREKFLAKLKSQVPFPIVADSKGKLAELYRVEGMPTTLFIDRQGRIRYGHTGFKEDHKRNYKKELDVLLGEK